MEAKRELPEEVRRFVEREGKPVTSKQIEPYIRLVEVEERSRHLETIIAAWEQQQS